MERIDSVNDLRRAALNAGRYGVITVPAQAVLDLVPAGTLNADEIDEAIADAEDAARTANSAADNAMDAADHLESLIEQARKGAKS